MADEETLASRIGIYDNLNDPIPSWNQPGVIATIAASTFCIAGICILSRLYVRLFVLNAKGWDDLFVVFYLISGLMGGVSLCIAPQYGLGQHFINLNVDVTQSYLKVFYIINASYNMSATFIKLSLLFQYLRLYRSGKMRIICMVMVGLVASWGAAYSFLAWFPCFPVGAYWNLEMKATRYAFGSEYAAELFRTYASHTAVNTALDMIVFAIPVPLYFQRETGKRTKLGLVGVVIMGAIVNALTIWRLATIVEHRATTSPTFDPTWYAPASIILGTLEVNIASICASVPIFWPPLKARLDEIFVTREVTITTNRRSNRFSTEPGNTMELQRPTSEDCENRWNRCPSRAGSESSQSRLAELAPVEKRRQHYMDDFILDQVDPLRKKGPFIVESEIMSSGGVGRKKSNRHAK
ncbi:hypothetical protein M426DRAFT_324995 [Hypoxylon sp. CI-4A]|nr:hypothetical protein M426DRAFT_324995 [Hypoxylon sp. CI-4A]